MRLTLRTMLAYLDDVLEPADSADIGKKIEESEIAANVVHRTRDVVRRLRLGAPKLSGRGMGLDPNTVAEYLDNSLPDDRVAEFERVCLESEVHLAEVACCHQILTLVLGEPAEIDPKCRQRMYQIPQEAAAIAQQEAEAAAPPPPRANKPETNGVTAPPPAPKVERKKPQVPQYLREPAPSQGSWRGLAAGVLAAALVGVLLMATGQLEKDAWLGRLLGIGKSNEVAVNPENAKLPEKPVDEAPELQQPAEVTPAKSPVDDTVPPADPPLPKENATPANVHADAATKPADSAKPADAAKPTDANVPAEKPAAKPADVPTNPPPTTPPATVPAEKPAELPADKPAERPAETLGRLISSNQVLMRFNLAANTWQRVPAQQTVFERDMLVSPPLFRSTIALSSGVTLELLGRTKVELMPPAVDGTPRVKLHFGRVVLLTAAKPQTSVQLLTPGRESLVTFGDAGSTLGVEAKPLRVEGSDPEKTAPLWQVDVYVSSGKIAWTDAGGQPVTIDAPAARTIAPGAAAIGGAGDKLPEWIVGDQLVPINKQGAEFVAESLIADRPTVLGLKELAIHQRAEVRTLAAQTLACIDDFGPLVSDLNRDEGNQRNTWNDYVEDLRAAVSRGPETAALVRETYAMQRGDSGAALYRLLWGFTDADLKAGAAEKLVENLDHPDMDFRALSFWNLRNITGANLFYKPNATAEQRKLHSQKWKQRLAAGLIVNKPEGAN